MVTFMSCIFYNKKETRTYTNERLYNTNGRGEERNAKVKEKKKNTTGKNRERMDGMKNYCFYQG